jgi:hypothetical protein
MVLLAKIVQAIQFLLLAQSVWRGLYSVIHQVMIQALRTVGLPCITVCGQYFYFQPCILPITFTKRVSASRIKAALGNIKYPTHEHSRIALSHRINQTVSHRNPLVKHVAHFFMKSRSIFTSANSRFTLDSSSSTSVSAS